MDAKGFGEYFKRQTFDQGMTQAYIGVLIGEWPPGSRRALNETGVRRIFEGGRKLDEVFMWHLIRTFGLDANEAWAAARVLPESDGDYQSAVAAVKQYRHRSVKREPRRPVLDGGAAGASPAAPETVDAAALKGGVGRPGGPEAEGARVFEVAGTRERARRSTTRPAEHNHDRM